MGRSTPSYVISHLSELGQLPTNDTFSAADVREIGGIKLHAMLSNSVIEAAGHRYEQREETEWQFSKQARELIEEKYNEDHCLPCGHTGFSNVRGEEYECTVCEAEYDRETIRVSLF